MLLAPEGTVSKDGVDVSQGWLSTLRVLLFAGRY